MSTKEEKCMKIEFTYTQLTVIERMQSGSICFLLRQQNSTCFVSMESVTEKTFEEPQSSYYAIVLLKLQKGVFNSTNLNATINSHEVKIQSVDSIRLPLNRHCVAREMDFFIAFFITKIDPCVLNIKLSKKIHLNKLN